MSDMLDVMFMICEEATEPRDLWRRRNKIRQLLGEFRILRFRAAELEQELSAWERGKTCDHCLRCGDDGKCNCGFSPMYVPLTCNCYRPDGTWQHPAYEVVGETEGDGEDEAE